MEISELMPLQAKIADRFSIVRGIQTTGTHDSRMLTTGFKPGVYRPAFGSVVSKLQPARVDGSPAYVTLVQETNLPFGQDPAYLGPAHSPFALRGKGMADLSLPKGLTLDRLEDRESLLLMASTPFLGPGAGDGPVQQSSRCVRPEPGAGEGEGDVWQVPRHAAVPAGEAARRGGRVSGDALRRLGEQRERGRPEQPLNWDTHEDNFNRLRVQAPHLDRALYALLTDLSQRGLDKDVVVVAAGEMGRSPRVGKSTGATNSPNGRDHWETGFALVAGGGIVNGQIVGTTDRYADRAKGKPFTPQNLLATLYELLGIDTGATFPDHNGRPQFILDDRDKIEELL